jgi:IS4 transposase
MKMVLIFFYTFEKRKTFLKYQKINIELEKWVTKSIMLSTIIIRNSFWYFFFLFFFCHVFNCLLLNGNVGEFKNRTSLTGMIFATSMEKLYAQKDFLPQNFTY